MNKSNSPILLVGSGRSGTTWLHDLLTMNFDYRGIFEPLNEIQAPIDSKYANMYLTGDDEAYELEQYLANIFYNRVDDAWFRWLHCGIDKDTHLLKRYLQYVYNSPKFKFWASHRVVKFIKANLMVEWLQNKFEIKSIIYLVRHPCATIMSQKRLGWNTDLTSLLAQEKIMNLFHHNYDFISRASTEIEKLTIQWCIENAIVLKQINERHIDVIFLTYEDLVSDPSKVLSDILAGAFYPEGIRRKIISKMEKYKQPRKESIFRWQSKLDICEQKSIIDITRMFGIEMYGLDPFPLDVNIADI